VCCACQFQFPWAYENHIGVSFFLSLCSYEYIDQEHELLFVDGKNDVAFESFSKMDIW
jgi:hypothetical protein